MVGVRQAKTAINTFRRRGMLPMVDSVGRYLSRQSKEYLVKGPVDDYCFEKSLSILKEMQSSEQDVPDAVDTAFDYRGIGPYNTIKPQQAEGDMKEVLEYIDQQDVNSVLEIGTANGGTLYCWSRLPGTSSVISLDLGYYPQQRQRLFSAFDPETSVSSIVGNSHNRGVQEQVHTVCQGGADLIFIDGDHQFESVKQDFEDYNPISNKYVLFDDIMNKGPVERFWREIIEPSYDTETFGEFDENNTRRRGFGIVHC